MEYIEKEAKNDKLWHGIREFTLTERIIRRITNKEINRIADIGCGDGHLIQTIIKERNNVSEIYGIDMSKIRLNRVKSISKKIKIVKADVTHLPFEDNFFDVVICSEVLEHVKNYEKAIKELLRVTKNQLIMTVPNEEKLMKTLCPRCKKYHYIAGHINSFHKNKLKKILFTNSPDKKIDIKFEKFHTIYSYNSLTKRFPMFIRTGLDKILTSLEHQIKFLKPNYLMAVVTNGK